MYYRISPDDMAAMLEYSYKRILITSFVSDTNMAVMSIVFCVYWDCVKTKKFVFHNTELSRSNT